jgi:hypothetical protein
LEGFQPRTSPCKNKHEVIVEDDKYIHDVWADYSKELLNPPGKGIIPEEKVYFGPEQDIRAPSEQEVSAVIRKKNHRAPGEDSISAESVTGGGRMLWRKIHILKDKVLREECQKEEEEKKTNKNHEESQSEYLLQRPKFELRRSKYNKGALPT